MPHVSFFKLVRARVNRPFGHQHLWEAWVNSPSGHPVNQYKLRAYTIIYSNVEDKWKYVLVVFRRATKSLKLKCRGLKLECREIGTHTTTSMPWDSHHIRTLRKEGRKEGQVPWWLTYKKLKRFFMLTMIMNPCHGMYHRGILWSCGLLLLKVSEGVKIYYCLDSRIQTF